MINFLIRIIAILLVLITTTMNAQNFQGKAIYQTKTTLEIDLGNSEIPADRIKMIKERMKNQLEKTYVLTFDKTASIYKEEEKLSQSGSNGGIRVMMMGGAGSGKYYKNTKTKKSTKEQELSGKNFLIKDDLVTYEWKMEQETKMIGQNMCFKATTVIQRTKRDTNMRFGRGRNNESEENDNENKVVEMEDVIVTAWYTLDIPISHGPDNYWGLPGLILEVGFGNTNILCTKIIMNPKEKVKINEPKKGKVVNQEEFDKIFEQKRKEMRERFRNERKKSGGGSHTIRIRG